MTERYTPGPWFVKTYGYTRATIYTDNDDLAYIATAYLDEDEANIKLMAAAPAMLEALRLCVEELGNCDEEFGGSHYCGRCDSAIDRNHEIREQALAALAQATGGTK